MKFRRKHSLETLYEIVEFIDPPRPINKVCTNLGLSWNDLTKYLKILEDVDIITDTKKDKKRMIARTYKEQELDMKDTSITV